MICQKCGHCCKTITLPAPQATHLLQKQNREFLHARGFTLGEKTMSVISRCPHLTEDNLCDMYATRPEVCRLYTCEK